MEASAASGRNNARAVAMALVALGIYGMAGQIMLVRELLVVFYGNELSLGLIFSSWFIWVAVGAATATRMVPRFTHPTRTLGVALLLAFVFLPGELGLVRLLRGILGTPPGLLIPLTQMGLATALTLLPLSFFIGFTFPLAARAFAPRAEGAAARIGILYVAETAGAVVGAVVFTLLAAGRISHFQSQALFGLPLVVSIAVLSAISRDRESRLWPIMGSALPALLVIALLAGGARWLETVTVQARWRSGHPGMHLVEWRDSRYQHLAVAQLEDQTTIYGNGSPILSLPDSYEAGPAAHLVLTEHPAPSRVLLVGGGTPAMIAEMLKHPVRSLEFVEMDPELIDLTRAYAEDVDIFGDPRLAVRTGDGRGFLKRTDHHYDVILLRLPDPSTAMLNRFYTVEFFREAAERLDPLGILAFSVGGAVNYVGEEVGPFRATLFRSLAGVFPQVIVSPGDRNVFVGAKTEGVLAADAGQLETRYNSRGIESAYFSAHLFPILLDPERVAWLRASLEAAGDVDLNSDWRPVSYFQNVLLWDRFSGSGMGTFLRAAARLRLWMLAVAVATVLCARLAWVRTRRPGDRAEVGFNALSTIATTGFLAMGIQMVILFAFQNQLGYVYEKIGLVTAAFMLGLFVGGRLGAWQTTRPTDPGRALGVTELFLLIFCLALPSLLGSGRTLAGVGEGSIQAWFYLLSGVCGLLAGAQFPMAGHLYLRYRAVVSTAAGQVDWADHLGACVGALVAGSLLIPLLGVTHTCLLVAALKAANGILLALQARRLGDKATGR